MILASRDARFQTESSPSGSAEGLAYLLIFFSCFNPQIRKELYKDILKISYINDRFAALRKKAGKHKAQVAIEYSQIIRWSPNFVQEVMFSFLDVKDKEVTEEQAKHIHSFSCKR